MRLIRRTVFLVVLAVLAALGWTGYLWVRDSPLVAVRDVTISGATTRDAPAIRRALRQTARRMTTLNVREAELADAVDSFPIVRSVSASPDFPNGLRVKVNEYRPVAVLSTAAGRRVPVAGDGTLLPRLSRARLPAVKVDAIPTSGELKATGARRIVSVLSRAPRRLRPSLARAYSTRRGIRIALRRGPLLYFGDAGDATAKWAAAARVLADSTSEGARFIDVRLPERPAAGGFARGDAGSRVGDAASEPQP